MRPYEARLRDIASRIPVERIGIYVEQSRILWRDTFTGETGLVCLAPENSPVHPAKNVLRCMRKLHEEYDAWNWPSELLAELSRRAYKASTRKPVERFTDADAVRIWNKKFALQEEEYYSAPAIRTSSSTLFGSAHIGGSTRRSRT